MAIDPDPLPVETDQEENSDYFLACIKQAKLPPSKRNKHEKHG
jgi:hypothetical protein